MEASLATWGFSIIANSLWDIVLEKGSDRLIQSLNKTDIEKAIKSGEIAVKEWEKKLPPQECLFYFAKPDGWNGVKKNLQQYFNNSGVLTELEKPLTNQGKPDIHTLITIFEQEAEAKKIKLNQEYLRGWIEIFVNAYFQKTDTYIKFQVAKEDYFKRLANWFDDVKFAGIPVPGQEIEKSEKLANIFVMPDVLEDVSTRGVFERDLFFRESQELEEKLLANSSGRKFLASDLWTQERSRKSVSVLGNLKNSSEKVINSLLELLQDENDRVSFYAALALVMLKNSSEKVINSLLELLEDENYDVRRSAANALVKLNINSEKVINTLLELLQDDIYLGLWSAANTLKELGQKSHDILPTIIQWMEQHQDSEYIGRYIDVLWSLVVDKPSPNDNHQ